MVYACSNPSEAVSEVCDQFSAIQTQTPQQTQSCSWLKAFQITEQLIFIQPRTRLYSIILAHEPRDLESNKNKSEISCPGVVNKIQGSLQNGNEALS